MADIFDEVAREIRLDHDRSGGWCSYKSDEEAESAIAALLRERFGGMEEAIHKVLDSFGFERWSEDVYIYPIAIAVNRWNSNGDGTGSVTERSESTASEEEKV